MLQSCFEARKRSVKIEGEKRILMLGVLHVAKINHFV